MKKTSALSKKQAEVLWANLRSAFQRADETIRDIIATRAWEPLGYPTFAAAWTGELQGIRIAAEARAEVVYQMHLNDGLDAKEIGKAIGVGSGLGPRSIEKLIEDADMGIPIGKASVVRRHIRAPRTESRVLHVELGAETLRRYQDLARVKGVELTDVVRVALVDWAQRVEADKV